MSNVTPMHLSRAERRAAIGQRPMAFGRHGQSAGTVRVRPQLAKPARAIRETRMAFVPSKSAQADLEPRHLLPLGEWRPTSSPQLLGDCRPERRSACKPVGRLRYSADEGQS